LSVALKHILELVGKLDDSPGNDTPRERFRKFLTENVSEIGQVRDYLEECLREPGGQHDRALQDLVNFLGRFLGFEVEFGRYQGLPGQLGHDGFWQSPSGLHVVVEVKTSEVFPINTATLLGYIHELVGQGRVVDREHALGVYVIGRPDPEIRQLENAIIAQRLTGQLRIISALSLVSLAEMKKEYDVTHEEMLSLISPSGPRIDELVDIMSRMLAEPKPVEKLPQVEVPGPMPGEVATYWITPVKSDDVMTAEETIEKLVGKEGIYAFGDNTPGRKSLKTGDWICFYAKAKGVVAHAEVASKPERTPHPKVRHPDRFPWTFQVRNQKLYLNNPVIIDANVRTQLEFFHGKDPGMPWGLMVQATRTIPQHDFQILTRKEPN
jgi:hypothetical protein